MEYIRHKLQVLKHLMEQYIVLDQDNEFLEHTLKTWLQMIKNADVYDKMDLSTDEMITILKWYRVLGK